MSRVVVWGPERFRLAREVGRYGEGELVSFVEGCEGAAGVVAPDVRPDDRLVVGPFDVKLSARPIAFTD